MSNGMKIVLATQNQRKAQEIKEILADLNFEIVTAKQLGITQQVEEDGQTCQENALKKAKFVAKKSGNWALGDDAGLFIKALKGLPGIRSKRWAGLRATDQKIIDYTLKRLKNVPSKKRQAYFEGVTALVSPEGKEWIFEAKVPGLITSSPKGKSRPHLPYDVLFIPKNHTKTFAEMTDEEKNNLSHRSIALTKLKKFLRKNL